MRKKEYNVDDANLFPRLQLHLPGARVSLVDTPANIELLKAMQQSTEGIHGFVFRITPTSEQQTEKGTIA